MFYVSFLFILSLYLKKSVTYQFTLFDGFLLLQIGKRDGYTHIYILKKILTNIQLSLVLYPKSAVFKI